MAFSIVGLSETILQAEKDAAEKAEALRGQDALAFLGCTGSGKTTVFSYLQGAEFTCVGPKLQQEKGPTAGAEIGDGRRSSTRGSQVAAGTGGLLWVDLAGTQDTAGPAAELCGAVHCSAVLQAARSLRVALVVSMDRLSLGNERGKGFVRDVEHVAGLFQDMQANLRSVGMVVTAKPDTLLDKTPDMILEEVGGALDDLIGNAAVSVTSWDDPEAEGMKITPAGHALLQHLQRHCKHTLETVEELDEGDSTGLLSRLVADGRAVFPVNVLQGDQRVLLRTFLAKLEPVQTPSTRMSYVLPRECTAEVTAKLEFEMKPVHDGLRQGGIHWAGNARLADSLVDLLQLSNVLVARQLLPAAKHVQDLLHNELLSQNKQAATDLMVGSTQGNVAQADLALSALEAMEEVRERLKTRIPSLRLEGWSSCKSAATASSQRLREEFARLLPEDLAEIHWSPKLMQQVLGLLQAGQKLGAAGSALCSEWAEKMKEHLRSLRARAAECRAAVPVVRALSQLDELRQFLPPLAELLGLLDQDSPAASFEGAKGAVWAELGELSRKMQEVHCVSGHLGDRTVLEELCNSTELNSFLGGSLVDTFLMKPLSAILVPSQEEIDCITEQLKELKVAPDPSEPWNPLLEHVVQRVQGAGELGPPMLEAASLDLEPLLDEVMERVGQDKATVQKAVSRMSAPPRPGVASASVCSGREEDRDEDEEDPEAERAARRLRLLLPADSLLKLLRRPVTKSANMALRSLAMTLETAMKALLKRAKREMMTLSCAGVLDNGALATLVRLNACLPLARSIGEALDSTACSALQQITEKATGCVQEPVQQQLREWAKAETGVQGWLQLFNQHVQQAQEVKALAEEEVHQGFSLLVQKVMVWRQHHLDKAREASEQDESWQDFVDHAVCQGLNFEESPLCTALKLRQEDFRDMVETQVHRWRREAEVGQNSATPGALAKLRAMAVALERLPGYARGDPRTLQLRTALSKPVEQLEAVLSTSELNFGKALEADSFLEACQWLGGLTDAGRLCEMLKNALHRSVEQTLELLGTNADGEDIKGAARRARGIVQSCDGIRAQYPAVEAKVGLQELRERLEQELKQRKGEAVEHLQMALEGRGPPSRALAVLAALSEASRSAVANEAMRDFVAEQGRRLSSMSSKELAGWALRQNTVRCCRSLPEELNSVEYDDLIHDFARYFVSAIKADQVRVDQLKDQRDWGEVKQASEQLRDVLEDTLELEILKPEKGQLKGLRKCLGVGSAGALGFAKEDVKRGNFYRAIRTLVTGGDHKVEQELCEVITAELSQHMNPTDGDEAAISKRLEVLKAFLGEVGGHPPKELHSLVQEAQEVCKRLKPRFDEVVREAVEEGLSAATGQGTDLLRTVRSLARVEHVAHAIGAERKAELDAALDAFFCKVRRVVEKVAGDVMSLDASSLALSLEPLRLCLQAAEQLSHHEEELLLQRLRSGAPAGEQCLREWVRQSLAQALDFLKDPSTLQSEAETGSFPRISLRCQIADKLSGLLQSPRVDLAPLREGARRHFQAGQSSLKTGDLAGFNVPFKVLTRLTSELPQLREAADWVQELQEGLRSSLLGPAAQRLRTADSVNEAMAAILSLRGLANEAPDVYDEVMSCLRGGLTEVQQNPKFDAKAVHLLGCRLAQRPLGQQVIGELPQVFGAAKDRMNNDVFRRCGEICSLDDLVSRLTRASSLGAQEWGELKDALSRHEEESARLRQEYFFQDKPFEVVEEQIKRDLKDDTSRLTQASSPSSRAAAGRQLITRLAMCYSLVRCGREYLESPVNENWVAPHRAQILTVFRLLHAHQTEASPENWFSWLFGTSKASRSSASQRTPRNHLAQVLTGEGKCLTLALVAAFLALQGVESDIVCYHKILTLQDKQATWEFYSFVGVQDQVRYVTFDDLCRERLASIKQACVDLLGGSNTQPQQRRSTRQHALLIDEVDVFFSRRFIGETWDGGFQLKSQPAAALVKFIFEQHRQGQGIMDITETQAFEDLCDSVPQEMHAAVEAVASALVQNIESWSKPEPEVDPCTGQIGYKDKDVVDPRLSYANKTVFAYLSFALEGRLTTEQAEEHLGIDLFCGRFSFAELPKEYCCIMGVTGTLEELVQIPRIQHLLKQYGFKHFTYVPSVFGQSRLSFNPSEHIIVLDCKADWLARIELEVERHTKRGNAVLVFFKNESLLRSYPNWASLETLTERTDSSRRAGYIAAATTSGKVTLLTRTYGRGIDFQMPDGHEVVVLQTYLSSTVSEERQLKGRTGRQGKGGLYELVLCSEHLSGKMGFRDEDLQASKSGRGEEIQRLFRYRQQAKTESKIADLHERKARAEQLERDTMAWETLLFDQNAQAAAKLQKLAALNSMTCGSVHYTVLLDNSGSMQGQAWTELTEAFRSFRAELLRDAAVAASTKVSVSLFNHATHTLSPSHAWPKQLGDIGHLTVGGGTDFAAAFAEAHRLISRSQSQSQTREAILFLTDGAAPLPTTEINALLADHGERIWSLTCVALGRWADKSKLQAIGNLFSAAGVKSVKLLTASSKDELVQQFVDVASDQAIHY